MAIWFDVTFSLNKAGHEGAVVQLGTSPFDKPTHWKQTIVQIPENVMEKDVGYEILLNFERSRRTSGTTSLAWKLRSLRAAPRLPTSSSSPPKWLPRQTVWCARTGWRLSNLSRTARTSSRKDRLKRPRTPAQPLP